MLLQVLEVKTMEGLGTTVDVVLINGTLREGDKIVVCGLGGPIVTRIKSLKTPQVLKEMRVKGALVEHKEVRTAPTHTHTHPAPPPQLLSPF
jgi:translation initiation factor 5B